MFDNPSFLLPVMVGLLTIVVSALLIAHHMMLAIPNDNIPEGNADNGNLAKLATELEAIVRAKRAKEQRVKELFKTAIELMELQLTTEQQELRDRLDNEILQLEYEEWIKKREIHQLITTDNRYNRPPIGVSVEEFAGREDKLEVEVRLSWAAHIDTVTQYLKLAPDAPLMHKVTISDNPSQNNSQAAMEELVSTVVGLPNIKELHLVENSTHFEELIMMGLSGLSEQPGEAQITKLTVGGNTSEYSGVSSFLENPTKSYRIQHLEVWRHRFTNRGFCRLFNAIRLHNSIRSLDLQLPFEDEEGVAEDDARDVHAAMENCFTNNPNIHKLKLKYIWYGSHDLMSALKTMPSLDDLTIVTKMEDGRTGGALFRTLVTNNCYLKKLYLEMFHFHDIALHDIVVALQNNKTLECLTLRLGEDNEEEQPNAFCRHDFMALQPVLADPASNSALKQLSLQFIGGGTPECMDSIANLVGHGQCRLESFAINFNDLQDPSPVLRLLRNCQPPLECLEVKFYIRHDNLVGFDPLVFRTGVADIIPNLQHLRSLKMCWSLYVDWLDRLQPDTLALRIVDTVSNHPSLEYVEYETDDSYASIDGQLQQQLNNECARNLASKLARKAESLPIQYGGVLLDRMENGCRKLRVGEAIQAACMNTVLAGFWKNKPRVDIDMIAAALAANAGIQRSDGAGNGGVENDGLENDDGGDA